MMGTRGRRSHPTQPECISKKKNKMDVEPDQLMLLTTLLHTVSCKLRPDGKGRSSRPGCTRTHEVPLSRQMLKIIIHNNRTRTS